MRRPVLTGDTAHGRACAARFTPYWQAPAGQIEQAAAQRQTRHYESHPTPEDDAGQDAFAAVVTAALERVRESEQAPAGPAAPLTAGRNALHNRKDPK
jgi:hypothetical protein